MAAYPKKLPANKLPLNDSSSPHRMTIAARCPSAAPKELQTIFKDILATADQVRAEDSEAEDNNKERFSTLTEWVGRSDGNLAEAGNIMMLHLPPTYEKPRTRSHVEPTTPTRRPRNTKSTQARSQEQTDDVEMEGSKNTTEKERKIGDTYNPDDLVDHRGSYFDHHESKLVQRAIHDVDGSLISPGELYNVLTEGTLFAALVSFVTYVFREDLYATKTYHIYIERLQVIDRGSGNPWYHPIPSLMPPSSLSSSSDPTSSKRGRDEPEDYDYAAVEDAFKDFSPSKKSKKL
ncbi:hypothetical protein C8R43DRAFT_1129700 [Mycena crocata]|nr:hypothetical protein C8R43DRAFT_1129700 [Mycena crocata]